MAIRWPDHYNIKYSIMDSKSNPIIEHRPWGTYQVLTENSHTKVKQIVVHKEHRLSYQSHQHRSETWTIVKGRAVVTVEGNDQVLEEKETIFIPQGAKHRIANASTIRKGENSDLIFIEVQHGDSFDEDDIERFDDDYSRV